MFTERLLCARDHTCQVLGIERETAHGPAEGSQFGCFHDNCLLQTEMEVGTRYQSLEKSLPTCGNLGRPPRGGGIIDWGPEGGVPQVDEEGKGVPGTAPPEE